MEIIVAKYAGACYGVNRSLEIVWEASKQEKNTATFGELIHNPAVIQELKTKCGVSTVDSIDNAIESNVEQLIIRSHGVPINIIKDAKAKKIDVVDATCPYVKNVQTTASILAGLYPAVIIIGKSGHPEIFTY